MRTYRLEAAALERVEQWLGRRKAFWHAQFDQLEQLLDETPESPRTRRR